MKTLKTKLLRLAVLVAEKIGIRTDLVLHASVSFLLAFFFGLILKASQWAIALTMIIGIGKEIYDMHKPNPTGFDKKDLLFDGIGCILGYLIALIIILIH